MRRIFILCSPTLAALLVAGCMESNHADDVALKGTYAPGTAAHTIAAGGLERSYLLHLPPAPERRLGRLQAFPLLIVLHGSGADGATVERMSAMDSLADVRHFIVAYPNGTAGFLRLQTDWNAGRCCGPAAERKVDDLAFVHLLLADITKKLPIDRRRIYVAGFSDGARMAYRVGCVLSGDVTAIGVVAGGLVDSTCKPAHRLPLVAFHGTADDEVPYADTLPASVWRDARYDTLPRAVPPIVAFWATQNGCRTRTNARQSEHIVRWTFALCSAGADVVFYSIARGGHAWPGGRRDGNGDEPTREISASALMVDFFLRHARTPPRS